MSPRPYPTARRVVPTNVSPRPTWWVRESPVVQRAAQAALAVPWMAAHRGLRGEVFNEPVGRGAVQAGAAVLVAAGGPGVRVAELVLDVFEAGGSDVARAAIAQTP